MNCARPAETKGRFTIVAKKGYKTKQRFVTFSARESAEIVVRLHAEGKWDTVTRYVDIVNMDGSPIRD